MEDDRDERERYIERQGKKENHRKTEAWWERER